MGEATERIVSRSREGEDEVSTGRFGWVWLTRTLTFCREKFMMQRGTKGPLSYGSAEETLSKGRGLPPLQKRQLYLSMFILGGISVVMFALLGIIAYRNTVSERDLVLQNALLQGYWIARSLEISHRVVTQNHETTMRNIIQDIKKHPSVRRMVILDEGKHVLVASDQPLEGTPWLQHFDDPPEHGKVVQSDRNVVEVVFPASFAGSSLGTHAHPEGNDVFNNARWVLLQLDITGAYEHYRDMVTQKVMLTLLVVIFGISAFFFVGVVQKYSLAHASLEKLEKIKHQLARFVPGTVQRLIEANPEMPSLDKVERDATILFLDIEQYTKLAEAMPPEALNLLIERYFSAFLDTILTYGGEINETSGDGIMAIFTANSRRAHAVNATRSAVTIREQAEKLNATKALQEPNILVNIGLCTGPVLLGATRMTSATQERLTYTASGMVTNIAARLCELATRGEIYLSEPTAHLVRHQFALHEPTYEHLKNLSEAVKVYKLL